MCYYAVHFIIEVIPMLYILFTELFLSTVYQLTMLYILMTKLVHWFEEEKIEST